VKGNPVVRKNRIRSIYKPRVLYNDHFYPLYSQFFHKTVKLLESLFMNTMRLGAVVDLEVVVDGCEGVHVETSWPDHEYSAGELLIHIFLSMTSQLIAKVNIT